jgi:RNA polymerase subunit RPABC4/transcription elongation factor Spt4
VSNIKLVLQTAALAPSGATGGASNPLGAISGYVGAMIGCAVTFFVIFWLSTVLWTFRDVRARTQDFLSQILATVLAAVFPIAGLLIYMILRPRQTLAEIYERQLEEESLLAEMTERQTCNNCHARVESDFQICPSCGQKLKRSCPKCERLLELRWMFCPYCAASLGSTPLAPNMPNMPGIGSVSMPPGASMPPGMPNNGPMNAGPGMSVPGNRF